MRTACYMNIMKINSVLKYKNIRSWPLIKENAPEKPITEKHYREAELALKSLAEVGPKEISAYKLSKYINSITSSFHGTNRKETLFRCGFS